VSVRAGIVVTGTEVLSGRVTDRNGPWVSERLGELGCEVSHIVCVGDRPEDLRAALAFLRGAAVDLIVTTEVTQTDPLCHRCGFDSDRSTLPNDSGSARLRTVDRPTMIKLPSTSGRPTMITSAAESSRSSR